MITMMKTCLVKQGTNEEDGDEGVKDLIEMTLKKMDHDKDGRVSFPDFETTVKNEPLMMEAGCEMDIFCTFHNINNKS